MHNATVWCLPEDSVILKKLNRSNCFFFAYRLPLIYPIPCHKGIRVSAKIKGTSLWNFVQKYELSQHTHTHTHPFNGPLSATAKESRYQKGKTSLDFTEATDSEWQWHQLGHMQVCTLLQTDKHTSTPPLRFFTGRMPFLPPNQQRQSTEGKSHI